MTGFLVRVGIDQTFGGWNAPVDPASREFVYVPIPEGAKVRAARGLDRYYKEFGDGLARFGTRHRCGDELELPAELNNSLVHLDPDFEHLTYGDDGERRGQKMADLKKGDFIAFFAGLRPIRPVEHRLWYALIGFLTVERVCRTREVAADQRFCNAHTRKEPPADEDIVVFASRSNSGRLRNCILIGSFRERAYRVLPALLKEWGELSVKNGYLQRSAVPPMFNDAARFRTWFLAQKPEFVQSNHD